MVNYMVYILYNINNYDLNIYKLMLDFKNKK